MNKFLCYFCLFVLFIPTIGFASYDVCNLDKYSIIYLNGMLNSREDAESGRDSLKSALKFGGIDVTSGNFSRVTLAYNPSHLAGAGDSIKVLIQKTYDELRNISGLDYDSKEMLINLHDEVKEGRILFVPHSQGNFYANSMYGWIVAQKDGLSTDSMNMYNVASPAQLGAKKSRYILSKSDSVIAGLVGSVGSIAPPNVDYKITENSKDISGHSFVDTYLAQGGDRMVEDIKKQLEILEVDSSKEPTEPCIPKPKDGLAHDALFIFYKIADPVSNLIKNTASYAINISKSSLSAIASSVGFNKKDDGNDDARPQVVQTNKEEPQLKVESDESNINEMQNIVFPKQPSPLALNSTPKKEEDENLITLYLERINLLKQLIEKAKSENESVKYVASGFLSSKIETALPITIAPISTSSTSTTETSTSTLNDTEEVPANTAFSTPEVILGIDIIPLGEIRVVATSNNPISPDSNLMISEYYIGKQGEASWVEVFNANRSRWVDTSHIIFMEEGGRVQFPVTAIAPFSSIILRSEGKVLHRMEDAGIPVSYSLKVDPRDEGGFYLIHKNDQGGESLIDYTYYGGEYCKNTYAYSRSCERMVTSLPGNNEEFWVRARVIGDNIDSKTYNTVGKENMSWNYDIYEGRKIRGAYGGEIVGKGYHGYVSGHVIIPSGTREQLDFYENWNLIKSESSLYENKNETKIDVYGILQPIHTTGIRIIDGSTIYINVHSGGVLLRNIYSEIGAPVMMLGGVARIHTLQNKSVIKSGALYISRHDAGSAPVTEEMCNYIRGRDDLYTWTGGKIYIEGFDCGTFDLPEEIGGDIDYEISKKIDNRETEDCSYYYNENGEMFCGEVIIAPPPAPYIPPVVDSTSTATSTIPIGGTNSTGTSTLPMPPNNIGGGGAVLGDSTSTPSVSRLTADGCFDGTLVSTINEEERSVTCGNGWGKRPEKTLHEEGIVLRPPIASRMQITEYYIGKSEGEASWFRISNMTKTAQLYMVNTDFVIDDERKTFPVMGLPKNQYIILKSSGNDPGNIPESSGDNGILTSLFEVKEVIPGPVGQEGKFELIFAWSPFEEVQTIDVVEYSTSSCSGIMTESGSCKLDKPYMFWNDSSDGWIN